MGIWLLHRRRDVTWATCSQVWDTSIEEFANQRGWPDEDTAAWTIGEENLNRAMERWSPALADLAERANRVMRAVR